MFYGDNKYHYHTFSHFKHYIMIIRLHLHVNVILLNYDERYFINCIKFIYLLI
jgi:hypothetical protein